MSDAPSPAPAPPDDGTPAAGSPPRRRRRLSRKRKLTFVAALVALVLLCSEGVARISEWRRASRRAARSETHYDTGVVTRGGAPVTLEPGTVQLVLDPELTFRPLPGHEAPGISINADGFRGPPLASEPGYRILLTGGSTAFGWGASADAECVAPHLARLLSEGWGTPVEVVNAGVPSYRLADELALVALRGLDYEPDLVVSLSGYNDLYEAFGLASGGSQIFTQLEQQLAQAYALGPALLRATALGRRVARGLSRVSGGLEAVEPDEVEARYLRLARRLDALCQGRFVLALQPLYACHDAATRPAAERAALERFYARWGERGPEFQAYLRDAVARWRGALSDAELRWVDLSAGLGQPPGPVFEDPCHLNDAGNRLLAERLAAALRDHPLAPR
ncbi:MAG: GDSL-type esterase/lipase family protein [Planctomycetota bacterium]